uniref:Uncharacterized protein n=1 Tax=Trichobilharzia regenti TaxID=157069 RepID=A0AA85KHA3_TRIRE|nr:unnamed protein product [Trichobilharzia regenti]
MLALSVSPCTSNGPDHIGLYATAENLTHNTLNTMNSNQNIQPNRMQTSHFIFQGATPLLHVPNGCNSRSSYLNYQHHLIPQSQMNTTLPNTYNNFEQSFLPGVRLGSSGLPLVAPVAQIDSLKYNNNNTNTTSNSNNNNSEPILSSDRINGFNGPSLTVAPYATASIIQNAVNNMNSTHAKKSCTSPIFYTPNNALFSENAKSSSEFTYELDEGITPTSMTTTNQNIDTSKYNLQIQHLQTPQMLYTDYANGCSRTNNIVDEENDMNSEFSSSGHRELGEVLQRHDFRNKSSSATSSSINNDEDRSYKWNKTTSDTLSSDFIIVSKLPTTATTTASSNNSNHVKQNNSKVITTSYQPHQSLHTPKSETIDANMYPYENRCMIPPPPESPPPPSPKYNHDENHNINNNCSTIENGEHYELTSEFSSTSSSSSSHSPYPPNLTSNEIKHSTPKYTIAKTKHEEPEQNSKFSSTTTGNIKNSHFNNNSHTHDQHAYYSKFTSSEVEDEEVDSDANHLKITEHEERIPNSKNSFNESKHHFNSSNHQHYSRNPPICTTEKQSVLQRPVMLLSEHNLSNSPQSSFFLPLDLVVFILSAYLLCSPFLCIRDLLRNYTFVHN